MKLTQLTLEELSLPDLITHEDELELDINKKKESQKLVIRVLAKRKQVKMMDFKSKTKYFEVLKF